jgi:hypothetical protein
VLGAAPAAYHQGVARKVEQQAYHSDTANKCPGNKSRPQGRDSTSRQGLQSPRVTVRNLAAAAAMISASSDRPGCRVPMASQRNLSFRTSKSRLENHCRHDTRDMLTCCTSLGGCATVSSVRDWQSARRQTLKMRHVPQRRHEGLSRGRMSQLQME